MEKNKGEIVLLRSENGSKDEWRKQFEQKNKVWTGSTMLNFRMAFFKILKQGSAYHFYFP